MKLAFISALILMTATAATAEIVTQTIEYTHGDVVCEGYLAYDDSANAKRPGVLVVHAWKGLDDYAQSRARQLAAMGYVTFALDMYGKGIRPQTNAEAAEQAGIYRADRDLMRTRAMAGLAILRENQLCEVGRVVAIGYCFGGGTVLELARSGADIAGVVSFHGNLDTPDPSVAENIICKILVCHGDNDPHVSTESVNAFRDEMRAAGVDYQFVSYSGAVHAFTDPGAGDDPSIGAAFNAVAERRSWQHMRDFFDEIFDD